MYAWICVIDIYFKVQWCNWIFTRSTYWLPISPKISNLELHPEFCEEYFCKTTKQTSYIFQTNRHAQRKIVFAKKELQKVNIVKNLVSNFLKLNHVYYLLTRGTPGIYLILALIAKSNILNRDHKIISIFFIPDCVHKLLFH